MEKFNQLRNNSIMEDIKMSIPKRNALFLVLAIFLGIIVGLAISTNFNLIYNSVATGNNEHKANIENSNRAESQSNNEVPELQTNNAENSLSSQNGLLELEKAYVSVSKTVKPWVVTITSEKYIKYRQFDPWDFFGDFFGNFGKAFFFN